jgi:hypothetical protein
VTGTTTCAVDQATYAEYQVIAADAKGVQSFASEPVWIADPSLVSQYEPEQHAARSSLPYTGYSGSGFIETSKTTNTRISIPIMIGEAGEYAIDCYYANGNGPVNTENKCAIRTLKEGDAFLGVIVLPQRGKGEWSNWGWSNAVHARFEKGSHTLSISLEAYNENMNGEINQAMLDKIRVVKIK